MNERRTDGCPYHKTAIKPDLRRVVDNMQPEDHLIDVRENLGVRNRVHET
jgi:hypothetical protein